MQRFSIVTALLVLALGYRAPAAATIPPPPDDGLGEVLRTLVIDSLVSGGRRPGQLYVAADAASDTLLRAAGIAVVRRADASELACPSSTDVAGRPTPDPVGYLVQVRRTTPASGTLHLEVGVSCSFVYRGKARRFGQGGTWELRRVGGRWHILALLNDWIT